MHKSSFKNMDRFTRKYLAAYQNQSLKILDVGSKLVGKPQPGATYKSLFQNPNWRYFGCDIEKGRNVNIVLAEPFDWTNIPSENFDVVISGQAFEHIDYFWVTLSEITRVLKQGGICCIIAPSAGAQHRFPIDCWRFLPDGMSALASYSGLDVVECYTDKTSGWRDCVLIAAKPELNKAQKELLNYKNYLSKLMVDDAKLKRFIGKQKV